MSDDTLSYESFWDNLTAKAAMENTVHVIAPKVNFGQLMHHHKNYFTVNSFKMLCESYGWMLDNVMMTDAHTYVFTVSKMNRCYRLQNKNVTDCMCKEMDEDVYVTEKYAIWGQKITYVLLRTIHQVLENYNKGISIVFVGWSHLWYTLISNYVSGVIENRFDIQNSTAKKTEWSQLDTTSGKYCFIVFDDTQMRPFNPATSKVIHIKY
jgi:hypothetical protein